MAAGAAGARTCYLCGQTLTNTRLFAHLTRHHHHCDICGKWARTKEEHTSVCRQRCSHCQRWVRTGDMNQHARKCSQRCKHCLRSVLSSQWAAHRARCDVCKVTVCDLSAHKHKKHPRVTYVPPPPAAAAPIPPLVARARPTSHWITHKCRVHAQDTTTPVDVLRACNHCRVYSTSARDRPPTEEEEEEGPPRSRARHT